MPPCQGRRKNEKYFEINKNNQNIRCKLYYDKQHVIEKVVLFGHGFAGHKDNGAAQKFADRVLTKYKGIAVLIFNLPCHGDDVKKKMVLQDCMTYMDLIEFIPVENADHRFQNPKCMEEATKEVLEFFQF